QLLARPRAIATGPQTEVIGVECPAFAEGMVYVSYPDCQLVAAVEASTGDIQSGIVFNEDGSVVLATEADYAACPIQCGDGVIDVAHGVDVDAGVDPETFDERPVAMEVSADGTQLYITSESSPFFTI